VQSPAIPFGFAVPFLAGAARGIRGVTCWCLLVSRIIEIGKGFVEIRGNHHLHGVVARLARLRGRMVVCRLAWRAMLCTLVSGAPWRMALVMAVWRSEWLVLPSPRTPAAPNAASAARRSRCWKVRRSALRAARLAPPARR
jgi:hypothetical protein